jgi:hypothetical protein
MQHPKHLEDNNDVEPITAKADSKVLTERILKNTESRILSWLRRNKNHLLNDDSNFITLTIMALENFMGYEFKEINEFYGGKIAKVKYEAKADRLKFTYERMISVSKLFLEPHSRNHAQKFMDRSNSPGRLIQVDVDWFFLNSVDPMDGSKYIGYLDREYEGSRFGTYPLHDDYGDEAWPDHNSWE